MEDITTQNITKSMDLGVPHAGAKSNYLANHFAMLQREANMLSQQSETLDVKRYRALVELHISCLANENAQNEYRKLLSEIYLSECRETAASVKRLPKEIISQDDLETLSREELDTAMLSACNVIIGLITKYMDQFFAIEEKYDLMLL